MSENISRLVEQIEKIYKDQINHDVLLALGICLCNYYKHLGVGNYIDMTGGEIHGVINKVILEIKKYEENNEETNG